MTIERSPISTREPTLVNKTETIENFSRDLTKFLRSWHAVTGTKDRADIVDFDVAPKDDSLEYVVATISGKPTQAELDNLSAHLTDFASRAEHLAEPRSVLKRYQQEFLRATINSRIAFFNRKFAGEENGNLRYIEKTMAFKPIKISDKKVLEPARDSLAALFESNGFGEYSAENIQAYRDEQAIRDEEVIINTLIINARSATMAIEDFLNMELNPEIRIMADQVDAYWVNWIRGDRDGFELIVNTHKDKIDAGIWTPGKLEVMPVHEVAGHATQMAGHMKAIDDGKLIEALGITATHDPSQIPTEGIAQTLPLYVQEIADLMSPEAMFEFGLGGLREMVYNNVHITVNSGEFDEQEIIDYVQKYIPSESAKVIKKEIKDRTEDPLLQTYRYAYGIGFFLHQTWAKELTISGKRKLLQWIYSQPLTAKQEQSIAESLMPQHKQ